MNGKLQVQDRKQEILYSHALDSVMSLSLAEKRLMCRQGPLGGHAHSGIAIIAVLPLHLRLGLEGQKASALLLQAFRREEKRTIKRQATTHPAGATANARKVLLI